VRRREEPNGYNVLHITDSEITIDVREWQTGRFQAVQHAVYRKDGTAWTRHDSGDN
jgi:hypothetical protein